MPEENSLDRRSLLASAGAGVATIVLTGPSAAAASTAQRSDANGDGTDTVGGNQGDAGDASASGGRGRGERPRPPRVVVDDGIVFVFDGCSEILVTGDLRDVEQLSVGVEYEFPEMPDSPPGFDSRFFEVDGHAFRYDFADDYTSPVIAAATAYEAGLVPIANASNPHRDDCAPWV